jgi:hypothetical protein
LEEIIYRPVCLTSNAMIITKYSKYIDGKAIAVPQHAMKALGERGGIAPTHS